MLVSGRVTGHVCFPANSPHWIQMSPSFCCLCLKAPAKLTVLTLNSSLCTRAAGTVCRGFSYWFTESCLSKQAQNSLLANCRVVIFVPSFQSEATNTFPPVKVAWKKQRICGSDLSEICGSVYLFKNAHVCIQCQHQYDTIWYITSSCLKRKIWVLLADIVRPLIYSTCTNYTRIYIRRF